MDQNTNPAQQGATDPTAGGTFDPFAATQGTQGGATGQTGATDPNAGTTPPWLSFSPAGDSTQNAPVNPWEQFAAPTSENTPPWEAPQATQANPWETQVQAPQNPWEQQNNQQPVVDQTAQTNPWETPVANASAPWDAQTTAAVPQETPMGNPWETQVQAPQNPWEQQNSEQPTMAEPWTQPLPSAQAAAPSTIANPFQNQENPTPVAAPTEAQWQQPEHTSTPTWDDEEDTPHTWDEDDTIQKKSSEDLLSELKRRFEEEEAEVAEQIQVHENNIKEEQEAIRSLKANRRSQVANMKHMFEELKVILRIEKEERSETKEAKSDAPASSSHQEERSKVPHKQFTPKTFKEKPPIRPHQKAA